MGRSKSLLCGRRQLIVAVGAGSLAALPAVTQAFNTDTLATGVTSADFQTGSDWTSGSVPAATASGAGTDFLSLQVNGNSAYTIDYNNSSSNDIYYGLGASGTTQPGVQNVNTGSSASLTFTIDAGDTLVCNDGYTGGANNWVIDFGARATLNIDGTLSAAQGTTFGYGTVPNTVNVPTGGTFVSTAANYAFDIGYTGQCTMNVSGTVTSDQLEGNSLGWGLVLGDADHYTGRVVATTVNLSSGGSISTAGATILGLVSTGSWTTATTSVSTAGTLAMTGGTYSSAGDVLLGMNASGQTSSVASGIPYNMHPTGTINLSGGTFTVGAGKTVYDGGSDSVGNINISGTGVLQGASSSYVSNVQVGGVVNFNTFDSAYAVDTGSGKAGTVAGTGNFNITGGSAAISNLTVNVGSSFSWTGGALSMDPAGTTTFNDGSTLTLASTDGVLALGSLVQNGTDTLQWSGTAPTTDTEIISYSGTAPTDQFALGNTLTGDTLDYTSTPGEIILDVPGSSVPEPASLGLIALGMSATLIRRRRHQ